MIVSKIDKKEDLKELIDSVFSFFFYSLVILTVLFFIFTPYILRFTAPGLIQSQYADQLILFTRILLLSPILLGISQIFGAIVQSYQKFFIYVVSPVLYNLGIMLGVLWLYPWLGYIGLVLGVVLGLVMHVVVQIPIVVSKGLWPTWTFKPNFTLIRKIVLTSFPRAITMTITQIVMIVFVAFASLMPAGSVTIFNFAYNLQGAPLGIIGMSYSLAAFPTLSRLFSSGKIEDFKFHVYSSLRHIFFWSTPVVIMFVVLRAQIVRTVLGAGSFDWTDTRLTAAALAIFSVSVIAQSFILLFVRAYYSAGKTWRPLRIAIYTSSISVILAFIGIKAHTWFDGFSVLITKLLRVSDLPDSTVLILPISFSLGVILNAIFLWFYFEKDFGGITKDIIKTFLGVTFAGLCSGVVMYFSLHSFETIFNLKTAIGIFLQGFFAGILGLIAYAVLLWVLKNHEIREVAKSLRKRIFKAKVIAPEQESL
jgi:putative peptidoglycan lipid II flippase